MALTSPSVGPLLSAERQVFEMTKTYRAEAEMRQCDEWAIRSFQTYKAAFKWLDSLDPKRYHFGSIHIVEV